MISRSHDKGAHVNKVMNARILTSKRTRRYPSRQSQKSGESRGGRHPLGARRIYIHIYISFTFHNYEKKSFDQPIPLIRRRYEGDAPASGAA